MKTLPAILVLILTAACVAPANAREPKAQDPTMVPTADATLRALSAVIGDSKDRQAQLSGRVASLQAQIATFKAKVKNPKIETGEQLSKEDLDAFNLLNAQLRYLQNAVIVETSRQKNLAIVRDLYRASFFTATMMAEYIGDKGGLDDDFDDFCQAKAKTYGLAAPVGLLFNVQDYVAEAGSHKK